MSQRSDNNSAEPGTATALRRVWERLLEHPLAVDLGSWAVAFGLLAYLPRSWGGYAAHLNWDLHRMLWRNLSGSGFRWPLEPADPLSVLRAGLPAKEAGFYLAAAALLALAVPALSRLSDRLYGNRAAGLAAAALVLFGNGWVLAGPALVGSGTVAWIGLAAAAVALFADGRHGWAVGLAGISGLVRPEGWALALVLVVVLRAVDRPAFRPAHAVALLAPVGWLAFDHLLAGDALYTLETALRERELMGSAGVGWLDFWPQGLRSAAGTLHPVLAAAGLAGLGLELSEPGTTDERRGHLAMAGLLLSAAAGAWLVAGLSGLDYPRGWLPAAILVLSFYAACLPLAAARRFGSRRPLTERRQGTLLFAAWFVVAGLFAYRTEPIRSAEQTARARHLRQDVRMSATGWLGTEWLSADEALLAGRSLPHYARTLGADASHRMRAFREVAADSTVEAALDRGVAVYVVGDPKGQGSIFRILEMGSQSNYGTLRFRPVASIGRGETTPGLVFRFERADSTDASGDSSEEAPSASGGP